MSALPRILLFAVLGLLASRPALAGDSPAHPLEDVAVVTEIDRLLGSSWSDADVTPSAEAPDGPWARRVTLDLIGRIPTVEELDAFFEAKPRERRRVWVDRLLGYDYREEHSRHLATVWANLLVGRTGGIARTSFVDRDGFHAYLQESFRADKPLDKLMHELVTATGSSRPADDDYNPAANFLVDKMADQGVQATAQTAKVFLGVAVQCTQCHDHPFNEHRQNQFWELNAFFRQTRFERVRDEDSRRRYARIRERDFPGEGARQRGRRNASLDDPARRAEIYYELRNGRLKVAYPAFLDGEYLADVIADRDPELREGYGDSGQLDEVDRREELADWIATSNDFARAAVNREWGRLLGRGFTEPVDDIGPHNPPSHPELLEFLAESFRASGHDLRRLSRWIVLSEAYGRDSRARSSNEHDDPALGAAPEFSRFYLRQMTAEQLYDSLLTATAADATIEADRRDQVRQRWLRQFNTAFANDENGEATTFDGSIPQALALMNGDLVRRATSVRKGGFLESVAGDDSLSDTEKLVRLYRAALARKPERAELRACQAVLASRQGNVVQSLRDVWWALLNSNEFILNH
ncbi:hypothetical protein Mal64_20270 [Pseudobythopirellula maris]|uniref:DUF1549 domain-containing protein n=1 Tax=Pseudobythopirellula maris TaxID=2527991 RepID=A0A5C5ZM63_9BACT|nr:DUF1549 domain-containing protein [Pseudobythopirellula maris]TWT88544.1 hypothetical protein Mal64_20270 [Pseudobythopirellula maris]